MGNEFMDRCSRPIVMIAGAIGAVESVLGSHHHPHADGRDLPTGREFASANLPAIHASGGPCSGLGIPRIGIWGCRSGG
jgi:hypothetical protein